MNRVSIIIAALNAGGTIERAIGSCLEQTHPDKEILVIDGGSSDNTRDILEAYNSQLAYWTSEPDRGIYHAWNKALAKVTGAWVCFLGADDSWAYPDAISQLLEHASHENAELVSAKVSIVDSSGNVVGKWGRPWTWRAIKRHHVIAHPGALHHRTCFERCGGYNESYKIAGDYEFSLRLGRDTRAAYLDKYTVYMGADGVSHRQVLQTLKEVRAIQSSVSEIGALRAMINFWRSFLIIYCKRMFGKI